MAGGGVLTVRAFNPLRPTFLDISVGSASSLSAEVSAADFAEPRLKYSGTQRPLKDAK